MTRLRIALDLRPLQMPSYARRGIGRWLSEFTENLAQVDQDNHYILWWEGSSSVPQLFRHQEVFRVPKKLKGVKWLSDYALNPLFLGLKRPQFYFTADYMAYPFPSPATRVLSLVHDFLPLTTNEYRFRTRLGCQLNYQNLRWHDHVFFVSEYTMKLAPQMLPFPLKAHSHLGVGLDHKKFHPLSVAERESVRQRHGLSRYVIYVGAPNPRKNLIRVLQAMDRIPKDWNVDLLILGDGHPNEQIRRQLERLQNPERIKILGFLEDEEMISLLASAEGLVFPSLAEGFGFPVLEAMACGTPVLTSNCSSLPEAAGDAALLVDPTSVESIHQGIGQLLESGDDLQPLREKGIVHASRFSWEACVAHFLKTIDSMSN